VELRVVHQHRTDLHQPLRQRVAMRHVLSGDQHHQVVHVALLRQQRQPVMHYLLRGQP
jgi:hypothetical protein